jgi:hypothetical protein
LSGEKETRTLFESGSHTIYLTDGNVWVDGNGEVTDEDPPEFCEDQQPE